MPNSLMLAKTHVNLLLMKDGFQLLGTLYRASVLLGFTPLGCLCNLKWEAPLTAVLCQIRTREKTNDALKCDRREVRTGVGHGSVLNEFWSTHEKRYLGLFAHIIAALN